MQLEQYGEEDEHLIDIVPRLINDFKFATLRQRDAQILQDIKATDANDPAQLNALMEQLLHIKSIIEAFSKATGYKVLTI